MTEPGLSANSLFSSYFALYLCWLHSATRVTYWCMLLFFVILQAVPVLASFVNPSHILVYAPRDFLILPPWHNSNYLEKIIIFLFNIKILILFVFTIRCIKVSKYQSIKVSKYQSIKVSKYQSIKVSKYQSIKVSKYQSIKASRS